MIVTVLHLRNSNITYNIADSSNLWRVQNVVIAFKIDIFKKCILMYKTYKYIKQAKEQGKNIYHKIVNQKITLKK